MITKEYFLECQFNASQRNTDGGMVDYAAANAPSKCNPRKVRSIVQVLQEDFQKHIDTMFRAIEVTDKYYALRYGFMYHYDARRKGQLWEHVIPMVDGDVEALLATHPVDFRRTLSRGLKVTEHYITDGYHRAWAMIHRLANGQTYIPFYQRSNDDE